MGEKNQSILLQDPRASAAQITKHPFFKKQKVASSHPLRFAQELQDWQSHSCLVPSLVRPSVAMPRRFETRC